MPQLLSAAPAARRPLLATASAAVLAGALLLTGCGSGSPSSTGGGTQPAAPAADGSLDQVDLGLIRITDVAPVYLGIQEGYFEDATVVALLNARDKGLPITVVSNGSSSTNAPGKDVTEVAALPAAGIEN